MRNLLSLLLIVAFTVSASAQKVYFVFLQSDDSRSFYLKLNDRIYSSTASGYLILSNLVDSTYNFSIGFPSSQAESKFKMATNTRDRGFLIKNFSDGLGLFDLQDLSIIKSQKNDAPKNISYQKRDDHFTTLLSKAANDTSLLYAVVAVKQDIAIQQPPVVEESRIKIEESKPKNEETIVPKDTAVAVPPLVENKENVAAAENKAHVTLVADSGGIVMKPGDSTNAATIILADTATSVNSISAEPEPYKRSQVKKYSESSTSEGFGLVFYDNAGETTDTIRLLIPNPKFIITDNSADTLQEEKQFIQPAEIQDSLTQHKIVVSTPKVSVKTNCRTVASDNDFFKLRKNMAGKQTDEGMVDEAKKVFKSKCFSTEQIKNLSALFLTAAGKYQFFDAAHLHVTDQENFSSLQSEIRDEYYLKRFKAMTGD